MKRAITPHERLFATLRFYVTGGDSVFKFRQNSYWNSLFKSICLHSVTLPHVQQWSIHVFHEYFEQKTLIEDMRKDSIGDTMLEALTSVKCFSFGWNTVHILNFFNTSNMLLFFCNDEIRFLSSSLLQFFTLNF